LSCLASLPSSPSPLGRPRARVTNANQPYRIQSQPPPATGGGFCCYNKLMEEEKMMTTAPVITRPKPERRPSKRMKGSQALVECLMREEVEYVFGYPGGASLPIYDAMYDAEIKHILVRHEQVAGHAASGYARATGKVGVCSATSGPGAT